MTHFAIFTTRNSCPSSISSTILALISIGPVVWSNWKPWMWKKKQHTCNQLGSLIWHNITNDSLNIMVLLDLVNHQDIELVVYCHNKFVPNLCYSQFLSKLDFAFDSRPDIHWTCRLKQDRARSVLSLVSVPYWGGIWFALPQPLGQRDRLGTLTMNDRSGKRGLQWYLAGIENEYKCL